MERTFREDTDHRFTVEAATHGCEIIRIYELIAGTWRLLAQRLGQRATA